MYIVCRIKQLSIYIYTCNWYKIHVSKNDMLYTKNVICRSGIKTDIQDPSRDGARFNQPILRGNGFCMFLSHWLNWTAGGSIAGGRPSINSMSGLPYQGNIFVLFQEPLSMIVFNYHDWPSFTITKQQRWNKVKHRQLSPAKLFSMTSQRLHAILVAHCESLPHIGHFRCLGRHQHLCDYPPTWRGATHRIRKFGSLMLTDVDWKLFQFAA